MDRARVRGLDRDGDAGQLTDELLAAVIAAAHPSRPRSQGCVGAEKFSYAPLRVASAQSVSLVQSQYRAPQFVQVRAYI
jgi:hypothetical protein